jgi:thiol-disulfide isomerase/thioredoxin
MKNGIKYIIFYLIFTTSIAVAHSLDKDSIVHIETEQDLKNILQNNLGPSAISFHMDHCGWCMKMHPIFEDLAHDDQFDHITFYSVNGPTLKAYTHTKELLNEIVTGYPTIFFMNQGKLVDKQVGGAGREIIAKKLNGLSSSPASSNKKNKKASKNKNTKASQKKIAAIAASKIKAA